MSQPSDNEERMEAGDAEKFAPYGHSISINELHAIAIGFSGIVIGYTIPFLGWVLPLYAIFGKPRLRSADEEKPIGLKTIKHEPWWLLASYIPTFIIGVLA